MSDLPERIFLQHDPEDTGEPFSEAHEVTWCIDRINDTDCEYVRADVQKRAAEIMREMAVGLMAISIAGGKWVLQDDADRAAKTEYEELIHLADILSPSTSGKEK